MEGEKNTQENMNIDQNNSQNQYTVDQLQNNNNENNNLIMQEDDNELKNDLINKSFKELAEQFDYPHENDEEWDAFSEGVLQNFSADPNNEELREKTELITFLIKKKENEGRNERKMLQEKIAALEKENQETKKKFESTLDGEIIRNKQKFQDMYKKNNNLLPQNTVEGLLKTFDLAEKQTDPQLKQQLSTICVAQWDLYNETINEKTRNSFRNHNRPSYKKRTITDVYNDKRGVNDFIKPMTNKSFKKHSSPQKTKSNDYMSMLSNMTPYTNKKHVMKEWTPNVSKKVNRFTN